MHIAGKVRKIMDNIPVIKESTLAIENTHENTLASYPSPTAH